MADHSAIAPHGDLPAAMVEAAAKALFTVDRAAGEESHERIRHWRRTATAVLTAALTSSAVREEWGSSHGGCEHWGTRHIQLFEGRGHPEGWQLMRRLVITMPATTTEEAQ